MIVPTLEGKTHYNGNIHLNTEIKILNMNEDERGSQIIHIIMIQYALKTGLSKFKEQGKAAFTKKLTHLHFLETFYPVDTTEPKSKQRAEVVASQIFLKENLNGETKGWGFVEIRKQRYTIKISTWLHLQL